MPMIASPGDGGYGPPAVAGASMSLPPMQKSSDGRMPQPMSAPTLAEAVAQYGRDAYLLTIANDSPHTSFVSVDLKGNTIACAIGKSAARNIASRPNVSLFWPPREPGGYALVVNGTATGRREPSGVTRAEIILTKSVLHRAGPKPPDSDGPCTSDCQRIVRPT
jgi:hypothetical protein